MNLFKFSILSFENDQNHFSSNSTNWISHYIFECYIIMSMCMIQPKDVIIDITYVCIWFVANAEPLWKKQWIHTSWTFGFSYYRK